MSDFSGNVAWDSDQGLDAASALNGERLLLGRPVVMDESSQNYLEPVEGRFFAVPPTKHLLTIGPTGWSMGSASCAVYVGGFRRGWGCGDERIRRNEEPWRFDLGLCAELVSTAERVSEELADIRGGGLAEEIRGRRPELCVMIREGRPLLCRRIEYFRDSPFSSAARPERA